MNRLPLALSLVLLMPAMAFAAAYDDFARGLAANNRVDNDAAIAAFTAALNAGDLSANLQPPAHFGRAMAYRRKDQCAEALTDLNAALALKPDYTEAQLMRGSANACAGNYDAAIADYTTLIQSENLPAAYTGRALAYWRKGSFKEAAADFAQQAQLVPRNPYNAVWLAVTEGRAGTLDSAQISAVMAKAMAHRSDDKNSNWPAPLVDLFLGKTTADQVVAAGEGGEEVGRASRRCEAYFYTGQWWLSRGDTTMAKPLFDKAVDQCPKSDLESDAAKVEQRKLKS